MFLLLLLCLMLKLIQNHVLAINSFYYPVSSSAQHHFPTWPPPLSLAHPTIFYLCLCGNLLQFSEFAAYV